MQSIPVIERHFCHHFPQSTCLDQHSWHTLHETGIDNSSKNNESSHLSFDNRSNIFHHTAKLIKGDHGEVNTENDSRYQDLWADWIGLFVEANGRQPESTWKMNPSSCLIPRIDRVEGVSVKRRYLRRLKKRLQCSSGLVTQTAAVLQIVILTRQT